MTPTPRRLPAEWEPQAGVLLAWPHAGTDWAERLGEVEATYVALVRAITRFEPALICIADAEVGARASAQLAAAGVDLARCRFIEIEYDDTWLRDSGPISLVSGTGFELNDFRFTGWGGKFNAQRDDRLIEGLFARNVFVGSAEHRRVDWALEGGAIDSDGAGTLLTTWRCLH
jgi:agmatine/peptidylarginine deiminase